MKTDPRYRFKSRDELDQFRRSGRRAGEDRDAESFGNLPMAQVIVEPYPAFLEKTAPGGQAVPPRRTASPASTRMNALQGDGQSRAGLESTAFHEAYPGHHLQAR